MSILEHAPGPSMKNIDAVTPWVPEASSYVYCVTTVSP